MSRRRVVITGIGVVAPIGNDLATFWNGILEGRNGVGPITHFDATDFRTRFAMEVKDFDPSSRIDRKTARLLDRFAQFALYSSGEALEDSGLDPTSQPDRYGVITGSGIGGTQEMEEHTSELQSHHDLVCRLLLEKKNKKKQTKHTTQKKQETHNSN